MSSLRLRIEPVIEQAENLHLAEIIHQRCDGLKTNIQLKILHALVSNPPPESNAESPAGENQLSGTATPGEPVAGGE